MHQRMTSFLSFLLISGLLVACGGGRLSTRDASQRLKPVESLPEREQSQMPINLSIHIAQVANATSSYGNFIELFINGKAIAPEDAENNLKSSYRYNLRLQPGVYDVLAKYHVVGFWKERVFEISTDEPVKILPGQRTDLTVKLEKDSRGFLQQNQNQFTIRYAAIDEPVYLQTPVTVVPATPSRKASAKIESAQPAEIVEVREKALNPATEIQQSAQIGGVTLQINTMPIGADIYVDDRFVGQSPVRAVVNGGEGHVIQIARSGYREHLKVLDAGDLSGKTDLQIIVRLEKDE